MDDERLGLPRDVTGRVVGGGGGGRPQTTKNSVFQKNKKIKLRHFEKLDSSCRSLDIKMGTKTHSGRQKSKIWMFFGQNQTEDHFLIF